MFGRLFKKLKESTQPSLPVLLKAEDYEPLFPPDEFFPRPDWEKITEKIEAEHQQELDQAWKDLAFIWLSLVAETLDEDYGVFTSREFILLSRPKRARIILDTLESQKKRILNIIDDGERPDTIGYYTVLVFEDNQTYLPYVSAFGPDGEEALSGGMFFGTAHYGHLVLHGSAMWQIERVMAHELTHNLLWPSGLPLWLEEGLCMTVEQLVSSGTGLRMDRNRAEEHREFWSEFGLRPFWSGEAFTSPKAQEYAYEMAQVMVRVLAESSREFPAFLRQANWEDAGFGAARSLLELELDQVAAGFLGPGEWSLPVEE